MRPSLLSSRTCRARHSRWGFVVALFFGWPAVAALACGGSYTEAPPTLDYYLQRFPAKSVSELFAANGSAETNKPGPPVVDDLLEAMRQGPSPALTKRLDEAIVQARFNYSGPAEINLLHDLRDVSLAPGVTGPELAAYALWRGIHLPWFAAPEYPWMKPPVKSERLKELQDQLAQASPAMKPQWLYLIGALYFKNLDDTNSEKAFDRVLTEYPQSVRSEAALFMKARCKFSQAIGEENKDKRDSVAPAFEDYLKRYPEGHFRGDTYGWLAGNEYRAGRPAKALPWLIKQTEMRAEHPELFGPAILMIEKCLAAFDAADDADFDEIGAHPALAMALTYSALGFGQDSPSLSNDDEAMREKVRAWRRSVLPKLGVAVLAHQDLYQGVSGRARYFAVLAHAASDHGDQTRALALVRLAESSGAADDDVLFAKVLALQRRGDLPAAEQASRQLLREFPQSRLARGVRYRLGLILHDQKKEGEALLEFAALRHNHLPLGRAEKPDVLPAPSAMPTPATPAAIPEGEEETEYPGAAEAQVDQTLDALLNFADVESLAKALANTDPERAELRSDLRTVLRQRCLVQEDFTGAARFAASPEEKTAFLDRAKKSAAAQDAACAVEIAEYWSSHRKQLVSLPLDSTETRRFLFADEGVKANLKRRVNADALAFPRELANREMDGREELQHASRWWQAALDHGARNAAGAAVWWQLIEARRKITEVSPYTVQRAQETGSLEKSRGLYDSLVRGYPDSPEAKKLAVFWTLPGEGVLTEGYGESTSVVLKPNQFTEIFGIDVPESEDYGDDFNSAPWKSLSDDLRKLPETTRLATPAEFRAAVNALLTRCRALNAGKPGPSWTINILEDLALLSTVPDLSPRMRAEYMRLRMGAWSNTDEEIDQLAAAPDAAPIQDFIAFLHLVRTANYKEELPLEPAPGTGSAPVDHDHDQEKDGHSLLRIARNYPRLVRQADDFLTRFPKSPKREVVHLLRLRGLVVGSLPNEWMAIRYWPLGDLWEGEEVRREGPLRPLDRPKFDAALAEYQKEFPHGEYASSVRWLVTRLALRDRRWSDASDNLALLLADAERPVTRSSAAGATAKLFELLNDSALRAELLAEFQRRPVLADCLRRYVKAGGLPYLRDYLLLKLDQGGKPANVTRGAT